MGSHMGGTASHSGDESQGDCRAVPLDGMVSFLRWGVLWLTQYDLSIIPLQRPGQ